MNTRRKVYSTLASVSLLAAVFMPVVMTTGHAQAQVSIHHLTKMQQRLISAELINAAGPPAPGSAPSNDSGGGPDGAPEATPSGFTASGLPGHPANYFPNGLGTCSTNIANNIKVNQNCLNVSDADLQGRGQANNETFIAQDPLHPNNLVASDNDYVRGDGTCGAAYSTTRGASWNNSTVPNSFTRGSPGNPRQYWQAGGDTSVAWDTKGNAYLSCQLFNRGSGTSPNPDFSSAFVVFRSTGNNGASWNFPGRYVFANFDPTGQRTVLEDKQLIAVDNKVGSPFQDRIYVTWTDFAADGSAYIYEAFSKDYGESFSSRVVVSKSSSACTNTFGAGTPNGLCNANQFSQPFTGPDGSLYVTYANYNNQPISGTDNHYQVMLVKSTDGGNTFSAPVKLSDLYDLPDCDTYQGAGADPGRACVPEKGATANSVFRAANYPSGAVNPTNPSQVIVTFASYIHADSQETNGCVPAFFAADGNPTYAGVKTARGVQQQDPDQNVERWRGHLRRRYRSPHGDDGAPGARPGRHRSVVPVGVVRQQRPAGGVVLRPAVRQQRDHRLLRLQYLRQSGHGQLRPEPGHVKFHAAPDAVPECPRRRPVLGRLHRADGNNRHRLPDLE